MPRMNLAGVGLSVVILAATSIARSGAESVLKGADAYGDWQRDRPGTVRLITPQDLPKPGATASSSNSSSVVSRPASTVPQVPAGFKVELFASGLSGPRIIRTAPNGDIFVRKSQFEARTGLNWEVVAQRVGQLLDRGLLREQQDWLVPTELGWWFGNESQALFLP